MSKRYIVKKGDNPWQIAKDNNISLDEFYRLNPNIKGKNIYIGDQVRLTPDQITKEINIRNERQVEDRLNLSNISAIQGYRHNGNYVIVDKKNRQLTIYDKNNKPLYVTSDFSTGLSGNDFNTITYVDERGFIRNNQGNNSTPAGISEINGIGTYHGFPSFIRTRINNNNGSKEDIASSFHWGNIGSNRQASNGCVRIGGQTLQNMLPYLSAGTKVYTLPEQPGSRFTLKEGKLNFTADNPYGISLATNTSTINKRRDYYQKTYGNNWENEFKNNFGVSYNEAYNKALANENKDKAAYQKQYGKEWETKYNDDYAKRYWDDYNINIDKSYSPLKLKWTKTGDEEYDKNRKEYASAIVNNKQALQQRFGLTSEEYNHIAELALGIAQQETKFGTSTSYKLKSLAGEDLVSYAKGIQAKVKPRGGRDLTTGWDIDGIFEFLSGTGNPLTTAPYLTHRYYEGSQMAQSRGYTQIKNTADNKELQQVYASLGIDNNSIKTAEGAAIATIARLAYMYNNEVKGKNFTTANGNSINPYHALMYKWLGKNNELTNKTATPEQNNYIRNVNKYARNFDMYDVRTYNQYKYGGKLSLEQI